MAAHGFPTRSNPNMHTPPETTYFFLLFDLGQSRAMSPEAILASNNIVELMTVLRTCRAATKYRQFCYGRI